MRGFLDTLKPAAEAAGFLFGVKNFKNERKRKKDYLLSAYIK